MSQSCAIRELVASDLPDYRDFLETNALLPAYGHPSFLKFLETVTGCDVRVLVATEGSQIVGAFPYAVAEREGVGRVVNSLPWYGSHGSAVVIRPSCRSGNGESIRRALLRSFVEATDSDDLLSTTVILSLDEQQHLAVYQEILAPSQMDFRVGQVTDLPLAEENLEVELEATLRQKTRNLVRKSLKQDFVEVVTDEPWAWDYLARTHSENMAAIGGKAKPEAHFVAMRSLLPPAMRRLSVALKDGVPAAAMLLFLSGRTREYITPVISKGFRSLQPLSFLIWKGMVDAIDAGCLRWNWGGTWPGQEKLHHFKQGFGATDRPYSYLIRSPDVGLQKLRSMKSTLGALFPYCYVYPYEAL